jgi:hypothetical protein
MQAALIIVQFHKLAIIVDSLNLNLKSKTLKPHEKSPIKSLDQNKGIKDTLLKNLEHINIEEQNTLNTINTCLKTEDMSILTQTNKMETKSLSNYSEDIYKEEISLNTLNIEALQVDTTADFYKHVNKYCNIYHDFDAHGDETHSYLEFNWSDHAYYILQNIFPAGVDSFNNEIEYIVSLTTNSLGEENRELNTFPIRYSISCYIEKIMGYLHEDYDYANVNKLLVVQYKKFIKNVACYPQRLSQDDFSMISCAFNNEEILHIILLVAIVKSRTQLTYLAGSLYEIIKTID